VQRCKLKLLYSHRVRCWSHDIRARTTKLREQLSVFAIASIINDSNSQDSRLSRPKMHRRLQSESQGVLVRGARFLPFNSRSLKREVKRENAKPRICLEDRQIRVCACNHKRCFSKSIFRDSESVNKSSVAREFYSIKPSIEDEYRASPT